KAVEVNLAAGLLNVAAYHLQQAIEKGLKAFLLAHGWQLERTHDLPYLLRQALPFHPELAGFEELCQRTNAFLWARYPRAVNPPPTAQELSQWLTQAQQLLSLIAEALRRQP
ncbi:MAG: hypothetical protein SLRJCFUN_001704, partial [Candidatus Fervidibacter sp.]